MGSRNEFIKIVKADYDELLQKLKTSEIEKNRIERELRTINKRHEINRLNIETQLGLNRIITNEKLRQEMYVRLLLESCPDLMFIFDEEIKFLLGTNSIANIIGIDDISILQGRELDSIVERYHPPIFTKEMTASIKNIFKNHGKFSNGNDLEVSTENNKYEVNILPFNKDNGDFAGVLVIMHDITEIIRSKEVAEHASSAKGEFLSRMSHEIRTPLNAIIGMINIGIGTDDVEKKNYCFKRADSASKHLLGIVNDILDISKIEADKFELSYTEFDFILALKSITNIANVRAEEKHQNFVVNICDDVPAFLISDELRLSQVITNLLTNSIKFTPEKGTVTLKVEKIKELEDEVILRIEVSDNGIGISKEQQERLFMSFNQADSSISRKFGGTGLGLVISKRIVEIMGGKIWIESELGEGAKFIFTIMAKRAKGDDRNLLYEKVSDEKSDIISDNMQYKVPIRSFNFKSYRILIAEDVEINREIMSAILEDTEISIDYAENGNKALSMFSENPDRYNLILMDINMPEMDGYETTKQIRALEAELWGKNCYNRNLHENIPIIAMTANVFKEDIEKCLTSGMNDHTGKPIDADALLGLLNKYFEKV